MVAPNGARRTKADHPAIPVKIDELARTAAECLEAGAGAVHVHVRDEAQRHVLDAGLFSAVIAAINRETNGNMTVQITTEAVGRYSAHEQRQVVRKVMPEAVSIAVDEMVQNETGEKSAADFYKFALDADIAVQHIIYSPEGVADFADLVKREIIPGNRHSLLFPLGRYADDQQSDPALLVGFLSMLETMGLKDRCDWAACAFGVGETRSLAAAMAMGGKVRVGFENSLWHADGSVASDNAERVARIAGIASELGFMGQSISPSAARH